MPVFLALIALSLGCSHGKPSAAAAPDAGQAAAPQARGAFDPLESFPAARDAAARAAPGAWPSALSGTREGDALTWQWTFNGLRGLSADVAVGRDGARVTWQGRRNYLRDPGVIDPAAVSLRPGDLKGLVQGRRIDSAVLSAAPGGGARWVVTLEGGETRTFDAAAPQR